MKPFARIKLSSVALRRGGARLIPREREEKECGRRSKMKKLIAEIRRNWKLGRYDDVLKLIEQNKSYETSYLLTWRGMAIQLSNDDRYSLRDAELAFRKAIRIDPRCVDAMIELAWLYKNVYDDNRKGIYWMKKAQKILSSQELHIHEFFSSLVEEAEDDTASSVVK